MEPSLVHSRDNRRKDRRKAHADGLERIRDGHHDTVGARLFGPEEKHHHPEAGTHQERRHELAETERERILQESAGNRFARAEGHIGELPAQQHKMDAETDNLSGEKAERKGMRNVQEIERDGHRRSKCHRQEGIHEHRILRATIAFRRRAEHIGAHIEQERKRVPGHFLRNERREGAHENDRRTEQGNSGRNPEGFHDAVVRRTPGKFVLRKIPVKALVEAQCSGVRNSEEECLRRHENTKLGSTENTRHNERQERAANLEDCTHNIDDHGFFQELAISL